MDDVQIGIEGGQVVFQDGRIGSDPQVCDCDLPCGCYVEGYAQGKDKAHFEVRNILRAGHADGCGCEPCQTLQQVALQLAERWGFV